MRVSKHIVATTIILPCLDYNIKIRQCVKKENNTKTQRKNSKEKREKWKKTKE